MSSLQSGESGPAKKGRLERAAETSCQIEKAAMPLGGVLKRTMDICFGGVALVALGPAMIFIAILIRLTSKGPAIYRHGRLGFEGKGFNCLKFRTMRLDAEAALALLLESDETARAEWQATHKLTRDPRVTPIGRFLRRTSLDELPQLFNVLSGRMSLVGPRPIVEGEVARYGSKYDKYMLARPGMTGLWQVSGRSDTNYDRRVELDAHYAANWSPWVDVLIAIKTVGVVIRGSGAR